MALALYNIYSNPETTFANGLKLGILTMNQLALSYNTTRLQTPIEELCNWVGIGTIYGGIESDRSIITQIADAGLYAANIGMYCQRTF